MRCSILAIATVMAALTAGAQTNGETCVGSVAASTFRLMGAAANQPGPVWVSLRQLNNLPRGYHLRYQPGTLPVDSDEKDAAITAVVVPEGRGDITVLQPGPAGATSECILPFDVSLVLFVMAPQGLDQKRLTNLVTRDDTLVAALADYADQTADLEASLRALSEIEDEALAPRASTPAEQALLTLVRALNPAATSLNPLGAGRRAGPTSMMGRGADMFFDNAGGFVPGGGILPSVKGWLMPDTEFRSVFPAGPANGDITLCAQRQARGRNKIAYIWAYRLSGAAAPAATIAGDDDRIAHRPMGMRVGLPLQLKQLSDWDLLERIYDWALIPENGPSVSVRVRPAQDLRELRLDLRGFAGGPGLYRLTGRWDWQDYRVEGDLRLYRLDNLGNARVREDSKPQLVTGRGPVAVELEGANLKFIEAAWLHRPESIHRTPVDLPARHSGPPERLQLEIDTDGLRPGPYMIALQRVDGATAEVPAEVLPPPPVISMPVVHAGDAARTVVLTGSGLDRLEMLESPAAVIALGEGDASRRSATITVRPNAPAGRADVSAKVRGLAQAITLPGLLQVAAARPKIVQARVSLPSDLGVTPKQGEVPGGAFVGVVLQVEPAAPSAITVACADGQSMKVEPSSFGAGQLFVSFDPGALGSTGCALTAAVGSDDAMSDPYALGKMVLLPRIDKIELTNEATAGGFAATITGWHLETIERAGWTSAQGMPVTELPRPIAGEGAKQSLRLVVPWPSPTPKAPLFVWLRGETEARATLSTP